MATTAAPSVDGPALHSTDMSSASRPIEPPTEIVVHQQSRRLEIVFGDDERYSLSFEFLRVHSPSAAVQGHGPGQDVLQVGKREVTISGVEPVGHYAIRPIFSDGHDSGIFTWAYLRELGREHDRRWASYLQRLAAAKASRDAAGSIATQPIVFHPMEARRT
jgi:DUF971 family protein